jgi:hypothetical protein
MALTITPTPKNTSYPMGVGSPLNSVNSPTLIVSFFPTYSSIPTPKSLKRKCEEQGEVISDNVYIAMLLNTMSEEYKIAVVILESSAQLTPASIINCLIEEYHKNVTGSGGSLSKMIQALLGARPSFDPVG